MHTFIGTRQDDGTYLYSVGSWAPAAYQDKDKGATWAPVRDCSTSAEAAMWVSFLNGGAWVITPSHRRCLIEDWNHGTGEGPE